MASKKRATAELTADDRGLQRGLARAERRFGAFRKMTSRGFGALAGASSKLAGGLLGGATLGGTALIASEAAKTVEFEEALTRLAINSKGAVGSLEVLRSKIFDVSNNTGVAREEVLAAASTFTALTGDGKAAADSMELFAKVSKGTGSSMDDIATSAAAMAQNMKIAPQDMEKAFSILIAGGKAGAIELKDVAGLMASLSAANQRFAGSSGTGGLASMSAALQIARQGFGSAAEAATGLEALMGAIVQNSGKLKDAGIKVFNRDAKTGQKTLRSFDEIVQAIANSKLAKDPTALFKALGRKEAIAAFDALTKNRAAWGDLADATLDAKDVQEDFNTFQQSSAGQLQAAWNEAKNSIAAAITPQMIEGFSAAIRGAISLAGDLVRGLGAVGEKITEIMGGDDAEITKMDQDAALDRLLLKGNSLEDVERRMQASKAKNPWDMQAMGEQNRFLADSGTLDFEGIQKAIGRRRANDRRIAKEDAARRARQPGLMERAAAAEEFNSDLTREANQVQVSILMDPSTTDLKAKLDNSKREALR